MNQRLASTVLYDGLVGVIVEAVGDHPLADVLGEERKDLAGFVKPFRMERTGRAAKSSCRGPNRRTRDIRQ